MESFLVSDTLVFLDIDDVLCMSRTYNARHAVATLDGYIVGAKADQVWSKIFHAFACQNLRQLDSEFSPRYVIRCVATEQRRC